MQENKEAERNRITYLIWIIVTMILGLSSRKFGPYLPVFVRDYAGDTLWALMVFWGIGFLFVKMSTGKVMAAALLFCLRHRIFSIISGRVDQRAAPYHFGWSGIGVWFFME